MEYIHSKEYYIDLYDLLTIEDCFRWIEIAKKTSQNKEVKEIERPKFLGIIGDIGLYYKKGDKYRWKEQTIHEWMNKDRMLQEKYDSAQPPKNIYCDQCKATMSLLDKNLDLATSENPRVLFFFECQHCKKRKGIFDNGEIYSKIKHCPKCGSILESSSIRKDDVVTISENCNNCNYKYKDIWDFKADEKMATEEENRKKHLLDTYRKEFCISKEEGDKYVTEIIHFENIEKNSNELKKKEEDPKYQKAKLLKKLTVVELEKLITNTVQETPYQQLSFDKPEIAKFVIISFTILLADSTINTYDSIHDLQKLIKKALEKTNWRLMSEGISSRLGILSGRIKGYEREEDLISIV